MSRKRLHAIVIGRVQGVFFRDYTQKKAWELSLSGWVRNLPDGTVETEFEGEAPQTEQMLAWLHTGSPSSMVLKVKVEEQEITGEQTKFTVRY